MLSIISQNLPIYICSLFIVVNIIYNWYKQYQARRHKEQMLNFLVTVSGSVVGLILLGTWKNLDNRMRLLTNRVWNVEFNQPTWEAFNSMIRQIVEKQTRDLLPQTNDCSCECCNYHCVYDSSDESTSEQTPEIIPKAMDVLREYVDEPNSQVSRCAGWSARTTSSENSAPAKSHADENDEKRPFGVIRKFVAKK